MTFAFSRQPLDMSQQKAPNSCVNSDCQKPRCFALMHLFLLLLITAALQGCWKSEEEVNILLEDTYNQGWWDALDCVKRKGGSAHAAAEDCE